MDYTGTFNQSSGSGYAATPAEVAGVAMHTRKWSQSLQSPSYLLHPATWLDLQTCQACHQATKMTGLLVAV